MNIDATKHPPTGAGIDWPPWSCLNCLILYVMLGKSKGSMRKSGFQMILVHRKVEKAYTVKKSLLDHILLKVLYDDKNLVRFTDKYVCNLRQNKKMYKAVQFLLNCDV